MGREAFEGRFHSSLAVPVRGLRRTMRVLLTHDGTLLPSVIEYLSQPGYADRSESWQRKFVHAVGLLYDYTVAEPPRPGDAEAGEYLSRFVGALYDGTKGPGGEDPTGLYWPAATRRKVLEVLRLLDPFVDWCAQRAGTPSLNALRAATWREYLGALAANAHREQHSFFKHLVNSCAPAAAGRGDGDDEDSDDDSEDDRARNARRTRVVRGRPQHKLATPVACAFPDAHHEALFTRGFEVAPLRQGWDAYNVRDLMIAMLLRYGGLRLGEPFHLFVNDVFEDPDKAGHAKVLLYHPEDGIASTFDDVKGREVHVSRTDYLRTSWNGLRPRNLMDGTSAFARWKALMLEDGDHWYANVYWLDDEAARLFWQLYTHYVDVVRPVGTPHPWLFVTDHGATRGAPYPCDKYANSFKAALRRLGLTPSRREGRCPHGLRHAYAQDLRRLLEAQDVGKSVVEKTIQVCMHHVSPESQRVYTQATLAEVRGTLQAAWAGARPAPGGAASLAALATRAAPQRPLAPAPAASRFSGWAH